MPARWQKWVSLERGPRILLWVLAALQLAALLPEYRSDLPDLNDDVLHATLVERASDAIRRGQDPIDVWVPEFGEGYPVLHHYQHLPHVVLGAARALLGADSRTLVHWSGLLLLCFLPIVFAGSLRRLGFSENAACFAGVSLELVSTHGLYGADLASFGWAGYGLTTQLWALVLLGPALVLTKRALDGSGTRAAAALGLAALVVTHTVLAYMTALLCLALLALDIPPGAEPRRQLLGRCARMGVVLLLALAIAAYFLVPFFADLAYLNRSQWEQGWKYDSFGAATVMRYLVSGELFDHGAGLWRPPVLTVLVAVGTLLAVRTWRRERHLRPWPVVFVLALVLFFGRATWGSLADMLPLGRSLHYHRFIVLLHVAGAALCGVALAFMWKHAVRVRSRAHRMVACGAALALLAPCVIERAAQISKRRSWVRSSESDLDQRGATIDEALGALELQGPGRTWAGHARNWGRTFAVGGVPVYARVPARGRSSVGYAYHALSLNSDVDGYFDEQRWSHYNLFDVRYVLAPQTWKAPRFARRLHVWNDVALYAVETTGSFDLVDAQDFGEVNKAEWLEITRSWLRSPGVDQRTVPMYIWAPGRATGEGPLRRYEPEPGSRPPCGTLEDEESSPARHAVTVRAQRECLLMLKVSYHPRWRIRVDGESRTPRMLAPAFIGIPVRPGDQRVEAVYEGARHRGALFLGGLFLLALAFGLERRR